MMAMISSAAAGSRRPSAKNAAAAAPNSRDNAMPMGFMGFLLCLLCRCLARQPQDSAADLARIDAERLRRSDRALRQPVDPRGTLRRIYRRRHGGDESAAAAQRGDRAAPLQLR